MPAELSLFTEFAVLSVLSIGGMTAVIPEMQRVVVDLHGWMSAKTFADLYGLGYAMPGPNVLVATLVGFHVAGALGAVTATLGMCTPSILLAFAVSRIWNRHREARAGRVVRAALLPVTAGLSLAGGYLITVGAAQSVAAYGLTLVTVLVVLRTRVHALWLIAAGAALGLAGLV
jgi:chromate transporter